ncbi:signal peptidase I [Dorea sp. 210702-DFI.3.17]|uniref:signal peptidase I n=1 Tax=Dorea sp. 210702-DFI.3.17 TaxID=2883208 RepID=UPI001D073B17|nr:signal peptidase I [Dorea sp. 210702-DFI.3.17]MCB6489744.1 signal peptidase I [Dorea sp. 210702-DFI.3.17]
MSIGQHKEVAIPSLEQVKREREKLKYQKEYRRTIKHVLGVLLVAAAVSVLLATVFFPILRVSGVSMEPTLEDGQVIVLEKSGKFKTGDLIGFYYQNKILLKRVIGQAGDYIDIDADGNVYVNDEKLDEPYLKDQALGECDINLPYQVPDGKIFVMGDHRSKSIDSRSKLVGCVSDEQVVGRVVFRLWPLKSIGFLK